MVALHQRFNVNDPQLQSSIVNIEEGQYTAMFVESEMKENSKKTGHFIAMKCVIVEGKYNGTEFIERLNVLNPNPTAVKIAYGTLAKISAAVGFSETPDDTAQLHGKRLIIVVKTKPAESYEKQDPMTGLVTTQQGQAQSEIKGYLPLPEVGATAFGNQAPAFLNTAAPPVTPQSVQYQPAPAVAPQPQAAYAPSATPQPFVGAAAPAGYMGNPPVQPQLAAAPAQPVWTPPAQQQG